MEITLGQQHNIREEPTVILYTYINRHAGHQKASTNRNNVVGTPSNMVVIIYYYVGCKYRTTTWYLMKNQHETRPSEHPLVRGKKTTIMWDKILQIRNLFMAF